MRKMTQPRFTVKYLGISERWCVYDFDNDRIIGRLSYAKRDTARRHVDKLNAKERVRPGFRIMP